MARSNMRCTSCGFHFSVGGAQLSKPEGVRCPSCLAPVGVNGPVEGGPTRKPARVLEATPDTGALKMKLWIGVGAGVVVLGIVAALFLMGGSTPPQDSNVTSTPKRPAQPPSKPKPVPLPAEKKAAPPKLEAPTAPGTPVAVPESPTPAPEPAALPSQVAVTALPEALLKSLREEVLALKEWHLNLVIAAPERKRVEALAAAGKGGPDDVTFLTDLVNGQRFRAVKEEATLIRETRARLETEALEGLPIDKVTMNDARVLYGIIREDTEVQVKLERKFGAGGGGEMNLKKTEIKDVQKGKGIGAEFKTRWEGARKSGTGALGILLTWCKDNALALQASLAAHAILVDDPGRADARLEAGLAADPVARMLEAEKQGGFITYDGRRWLPRELKEKLLRDGYVLIDGHWMSRNPSRLISVPSLFRYEKQNPKPVQFAGNLAEEEVITYSIVGGVEKADVKAMRRFYAAGSMIVTATRKKGASARDAEEIIVEDKPTPAAGAAMRGEVFITIPLNAKILEASVMTSAEVKPGGSITVYLIVDGNRIELYTCDAKEGKTHKLPESIRGKTDVQLVAVINGTASYARKDDMKWVRKGKKDTDRIIEKGEYITFKQLIPEYQAMLFPSNANTVEVFRLTATTGEPATHLDKLFENTPEILKK